MKKVKQALPRLALCIGVFLLFSILGFSIYYCLNLFLEVNSKISVIVIVGSSVFLTTICLIVDIINEHKLKEGKIKLWFDKNVSKIIFCYMFLVILLISLKNSVDWTTEEVKSILAIEWTIFGLAITIFLVWNVLIVDYLKNKNPINYNGTDFNQFYEFLSDRRSLYIEAEYSFSIIVFLSINLFLILFTSSLVYMSNWSETIIAQNAIRCTFFFSTNTISMLFYDVIKPITKEKKLLKKWDLHLKKEWDMAQKVAIMHKVFDDMIIKTIESTGLDDMQKKERLQRYKELLDSLKTIQDEMIEVYHQLFDEYKDS